MAIISQYSSSKRSTYKSIWSLHLKFSLMSLENDLTDLGKLHNQKILINIEANIVALNVQLVWILNLQLLLAIAR